MQDYQLFMRAVWGGETVFNDPARTDLRVQNYGEALSALREQYLAHGYKVQSVDYLDTIDVYPDRAPNSPKAPIFAWHLVRELEDKSAQRVSKGDN